LLPLLLLALAPAAAQAHMPEPDNSELAAAARAFAVPRPMALPAQMATEPSLAATPRAECRPGAKPEPSIQGRLPKEEIDSGRANDGYRCNLSVIGRSGSTGGFRVHRYIDKAGHECAYYDTALLFPTNALSLSAEPTGVAVLDMTNPAKPVRTTTLLTPAMQTPHESLNISIQRGVLAAVLGNPSAYPGGIDVYDISQDCRNPQVKAAAFPASPYGHESGMSLDGLTFYPTSPGRSLSAVDITNPMLPKTLVNTEIGTHGMSTSDDGRRGYLASGDGMAIVDLSDVQDRKPNPQIREISHVTWSNETIPQIPIPVTIKGKPYVVEVDEYSTGADGSGVAAHGPRVGAARIIDISDEKKPRVVSNIRLAVHQPENRDAIGGDPGAKSPVQGYAAHYCNVPQRVEPGIVACSMIMSGLRVFDIRDPEHPKEIAYFMSPPSTISATGGPVVDERSNWAMSQPAFAPERGEIWYSDGNSGFYALKMDPAIWPFPRETGANGCVDNRGFSSVGVGSSGGKVQLRLARRRALPVKVDVFRVSVGRKVIKERRVASFANRSRSFAWAAKLQPGLYFARYRMVKGGKTYDTQRVVFERTRTGRTVVRPDHYRRDSCQLLRAFKLERPAFGGTTKVPLRIAYSVTKAADVTVTVSRGSKVVKRFTTTKAAANRTVRLSVPATELSRGDYRVRVQAASGEDQIAATLVARRL
jgi:hypothetical protein